MDSRLRGNDIVCGAGRGADCTRPHPPFGHLLPWRGEGLTAGLVRGSGPSTMLRMVPSPATRERIPDCGIGEAPSEAEAGWAVDLRLDNYSGGVMTSPMRIVRTAVVALTLCLAMASSGFAQALLSPAGRPDRVQGVETAPVTLIEYSSLSCEHCVTYHNEVAPRIRTEYVETGKVRLIYRPIIREAVDAVVFLLAESRPGDEYHTVIDAFYERSDDIANASDLRGLLEEIAAGLGIDAAEFKRIVTEQSALDALNSLKDQALEEFGLSGVPTFYINGDMLVGTQTFEALSAAIDEKLQQ